MDQLKRTEDGYFEIVENTSTHGKVWFNNDDEYPRLVKPSRTATIIYQISLWWEEQGKDPIPWDNFLIPENIRGGESQMEYALNESNSYTFNLNEAAFILLGLHFWALSTEYFKGFDIEKYRDDESRLEHIFWRTNEYKQLRRSNILHRGIDDIWMTENRDLVFFGREEGFFLQNDKFDFSIRARTRRQEKLIAKKLNEILTRFPNSKKSLVAEEVSEWLQKDHHIHLFPSSIERNYMKGYRELKAQKKENMLMQKNIAQFNKIFESSTQTTR